MTIKNIVLGHGNFVDGSGWQGVYDHPTADGYRVVALVYITAFAPDTGESVGSLIADPPPGTPVPPILPPVNGLLFLDRDKFGAAFAADVPEKQAAFMADSQVLVHISAGRPRRAGPAAGRRPGTGRAG